MIVWKKWEILCSSFWFGCYECAPSDNLSKTVRLSISYRLSNDSDFKEVRQTTFWLCWRTLVVVFACRTGIIKLACLIVPPTFFFGLKRKIILSAMSATNYNRNQSNNTLLKFPQFESSGANRSISTSWSAKKSTGMEIRRANTA